MTVDGAVATLGTRADPDSARIEVDGEPITVEQRELTLVLNKPVGYVVTAQDEAGRQTVYDLLPDAPTGLRYVGRLDADTSGLLVMTTDGELAHRLTHPRYEVEKEYEAWVTGIVAPASLDALRRGVMLEDGLTQPAHIDRIPGAEPPTRVRLVIHEGRKRQVRRMFEAVGHEVFRLERRRLGRLTLGTLPLGQSRVLTPEELDGLRTLVGLGAKA